MADVLLKLLAVETPLLVDHWLNLQQIRENQRQRRRNAYPELCRVKEVLHNQIVVIIDLIAAGPRPTRVLPNLVQRVMRRFIHYRLFLDLRPLIDKEVNIAQENESQRD